MIRTRRRRRPRPCSAACRSTCGGWPNNPLFGLPVLQRRVEQVLAERAGELGAEIRHGHALVGLDAVNLGWTLAAEVRGRAPDGLLDTYEAERRPVGEWVAMHTQAQMALLAPGPGTTALRTLFADCWRTSPPRRASRR